MSKPKIFVFCQGCVPENKHHHGVAIAEDGHAIAEHWSSSHGWQMRDMGTMDRNWQHDKYNEHYPDGWTVEYIELDDVATHEGLQVALVLNKDLKAADAEEAAK